MSNPNQLRNNVERWLVHENYKFSNKKTACQIEDGNIFEGDFIYSGYYKHFIYYNRNYK